ncbi:hypothetical protein [Nesterenkonia sp. K-15-9-6]|uniref:hypothetical protein n=1 Tax=Nesterenkonia sp. K-15-9-6 TaxID=3093918 RepID=UPI0040451900
MNPRSINMLRGRLRAQMEKRGWTLYLFSQNTLVPYATVQRFMGPEDAPLMQWRTFDKIREAVENLEAGVVPADEEDRRAQVAQRDAYNLRALERFMEGRRRRIAAARRRARLGQLAGTPV